VGYFTHYFHPPPAEKSGTSRLCAGLSETRGIWICDCRDHSMDDSLSRLSQRVHSTSQIVYRRPAFSGDQRVHRCRVADCTATDPAWHSHAGQRLGWKLMKRWPVFGRIAKALRLQSRPSYGLASCSISGISAHCPPFASVLNRIHLRSANPEFANEQSIARS